MKLSKQWHNAEEMRLQNRKWYIFKWETLVSISLVFIVALLNQIPNWVVKPLGDGTIDPILSFPLRNSITYNSVAIFLTIGVSIFIGVFTEIGKFAGKYGSALFVLVPSFVWLLSDRSDNRIEHIVNTSEFLGGLIFYIVVGIFAFFFLLLFAKWILKLRIASSLYRMRIEFYYNYTTRMIIVVLNVLIVLMLGYSLINYGILSLHLADITPAMKQADPIANAGTHNLQAESFKTYIAIVALFFAILMVSIGLSNTFVSDKVVTIDGTEVERGDISIETIEKEAEDIMSDSLKEEQDE